MSVCVQFDPLYVIWRLCFGFFSNSFLDLAGVSHGFCARKLNLLAKYF